MQRVSAANKAGALSLPPSVASLWLRFSVRIKPNHLLASSLLALFSLSMRVSDVVYKFTAVSAAPLVSSCRTRMR